MLIDSHCHFDASEFDTDRRETLNRALAAGVVAQIVPAVSYERWTKLKAVCDEQVNLYPAYGLHPMFLAKHNPNHLTALEDWLEREPAVAVGECGLDYFVDGVNPDLQQFYFEAQIKLARQYDLPLIIHARRAVDKVLQTLRRFEGVRGVVHSFSGSEQQANQLIDLEFKMSFGGPVTYPRASKLRRLIATLPDHALLLETDAPDQPDAAHSAQRNEPAYLPGILETIAGLRQQDLEHVAALAWKNTTELFGITPCPIPAPAPKS